MQINFQISGSCTHCPGLSAWNISGLKTLCSASTISKILKIDFRGFTAGDIDKSVICDKMHIDRLSVYNYAGVNFKMRMVKEAEERKNEILDVAERLFGTKGFDGTSTNDILNETGIARGTLYYHFKSKEDILDAMIDRMTDRLVQNAAEIAADGKTPVLQRLTKMMLALHVNGILGQEIMEQVHKPQNALMHQKMQEHLLSQITPIVTGLIEEGITQGICQTDYPADVAEMTLLYSNTVFDTLAGYSIEERKKKIAAFIYNLERLLGMEPGSMQETILPIFQKTAQMS